MLTRPVGRGELLPGGRGRPSRAPPTSAGSSSRSTGSASPGSTRAGWSTSTPCRETRQQRRAGPARAGAGRRDRRRGRASSGGSAFGGSGSKAGVTLLVDRADVPDADRRGRARRRLPRPGAAGAATAGGRRLVSVPVLTAVTGASWEAALVAGLERDADRHHRRTPLRRPSRPARGRRRPAPPAPPCSRPSCAGSTATRCPGCAAARVAVVGLFAPGDEQAETRLRQLGVEHVLPADAAAGRHRGGRVRRARSNRRPAPTGVAAAAWSRPLDGAARPADGAGRRRLRPSSPAPAGWSRSGGRPGRPGRTTVAVDVAAELAAARRPHPARRRRRLRRRRRPGARASSTRPRASPRPPGWPTTASSTWPALAAARPAGRAGLRVLTGISRADRWPELRPAALEQVWSLARSLAAVTVVDLGFCLEQDEELSFDTAAPRRNGATLATLAAADTVLAVGAADPVGMQRLRPRARRSCARPCPARCRGWCSTGSRRSAVGARAGGPARRGAGALRRGPRRRFVPEDREGLDAALLQARALGEVSPDSRARRRARRRRRRSGRPPGTEAATRLASPRRLSSGWGATGRHAGDTGAQHASVRVGR